MNTVQTNLVAATCPQNHGNRHVVKNDFSVFFDQLKAQGLSDDEIDHYAKMIENGMGIARKLTDINQALPNSTLEDCLALTWFIHASAYQDIDDTFLRGSIRLIGISEEQSKRFKSFYNNCPGSYNRVSSHFKEMTIGHQKGLDFPKGSFPLDVQLGTLLCGRLNDGSFFIKLEREALRISKPKEAFKHMKNWFDHYKSKGGHQTVGDKPTRRETDGVKDIKPSFENVISTWYEIEGAKVTPESELKKHTRIFQMFHTIEKICHKVLHDDTYLSHPKISNLVKTIDSFNSSLEESQIDHPHIASGKEVLLPIRNHILQNF